MTREEIEKLPGIVDTMLGESVTEHVKEKLHEKITEVCNLAIKALEQEPCEDAISRQATLDSIERMKPYQQDADDIMEMIQNSPSVTPKQKMGRWKVASDGYGDNAYICECSECKDTVWVYKDADRKWNYCPNCGAKMVEHREARIE